MGCDWVGLDSDWLVWWWCGGGVVIDDGGAVEVRIVVGGEGVGLLVWVWVCCRGLLFFFFFFFCVDGRLWVAGGGGVKCV